MELDKKKVLIGLTGRKDSAVAAYLLHKQGFQCLGLSIILGEGKIWEASQVGCRNEDLNLIKEYCQSLNIPFYATHKTDHFQDTIFDKVVTKTISGAQMHPCIDCSTMRMKILKDKANELGCYYIATGHYAKVQYHQSTKSHMVHRGNDLSKDQSYLLSQIDEGVLSRLVLPLGELREVDVDKILTKVPHWKQAPEIKLKRCFKRGEKLNEMIESQVPEDLRPEGTVIDYYTDAHVGSHKGLYKYEIGVGQLQQEFKNSNIDKNAKIIGFEYDQDVIYISAHELNKTKFCGLKNIDAFGEMNTSRPFKAFARIDDKKDFLKVKVYPKNNFMAEVYFEEEIALLPIGSRVILYNSDKNMAHVQGAGEVYQTGDASNLHRALSQEDIEMDSEGKDIIPEGKIFDF